MAELKSVGKSVVRRDALRKATGRAQYVAGMKLPGMLYGKLVRSTYAHARILRIDTTEAEKLPGVWAIVTGTSYPTGLWGSQIKDQPTLPRDVVRYVGEPLAAVAAEDEETAERACELISITYEELPAVFDIESALAPDAALVHEAAADYEHREQFCRPVSGTNIGNHTQVRKGDAQSAFAGADVVVESEFSTQAQQHVALETRGALATWDPDGRLIVWSSTQAPFLVRNDLARALCIPPSRIRVICPDVGGGFGGKVHIRTEAYAALLARASGRPVRMVHSRYEEFIGATTRHPARIRIKTGARSDGTLLAAQVRVHFDTGAYSDAGEVVSWQTALGAAGPYRIPNLSVDTYSVYTNKVPAGAFRGMGWPQITWAFESQIDRVARELGIDPLQIRLKNLYREGDVSATGEVLQSVSLIECLEQAAEAIGWGEPLPPHHGRGLSMVMKTSTPFSTAGAIVKVNEDGYVHLITGATEIGTGSETTLAQLCAEALGVSLERVVVATADTDYSPHDGGAISDRTTFHVGSAVQTAAAEVRGQLLDAAADLLDLPQADLSIEDGVIRYARAPERAVTFAQAVAYCHSQKGGPVVAVGRHQEEGIVPLDPETGQSPHGTSHYKFGAQAVEIEVDPETGQLTVLRLVSVHDCGKAINPLHVEGQIEGAVAQGIGYALMEEMQFEDGRVVNPSLMEYSVPMATDVPAITPIIVEKAHPEGPYGAKGVGEPGIIGVAPAIGNALEDAEGVRVFDLPITWGKVLLALEARDAGGNRLRDP